MRRILTLALAVSLCAIAPGQNLIYLYTGLSQSDSFGGSVAGAGDANGDGTPDYIIGAPFVDGFGTNAGAAYLYSGNGGGLIRQFDGAAANVRLGAKVAGGADVDGDGTPDQAAAGPGATTGGLTNSGQVIVYSGATGAQLYNITGPVGFSTFGEALALGDVNNDNRADIIIGAWNENFGTGAVYVYSGANGAQLYSWPGPSSGSRWGYDVDYCGDLDGDGFGEVVVGNNAAGQAPVVYDGATGNVMFTLNGPASLGWAVAGLGDVTGDGINDIAASAPGLFLAVDIIQVHSGADGSLVRSIQRDPLWIGFGRSLEPCGDLDFDTVPDLLAGSDFTALNGNRCGAMHAISGATGDIIYTIYGQLLQQWYGTSIGDVGDLNGDGTTDLIVGAQNEAAGRGAVRLVSGYLAAGAWADNAHMGTGCGVTPSPLLNVNPLPALGTALTTTIFRAPAGQAGFLFMDLDWPQRLNLGGGCSTHLNLARIAQWITFPVVTNASGTWSFPYTMPNDPALTGFPLTMQAVFPGGSTPVGLDMTNSHFSRLGQ